MPCRRVSLGFRPTLSCGRDETVTMPKPSGGLILGPGRRMDPSRRWSSGDDRQGYRVRRMRTIGRNFVLSGSCFFLEGGRRISSGL